MFFENRDGFYFTSLESMYASVPVQTFTYDRYTRDKLPNGQDVRNVDQDYKRINNINVSSQLKYYLYSDSKTYNQRLKQVINKIL